MAYELLRVMTHNLAIDDCGTVSARYAFPHDAGDFGRCLGLLLAEPFLKERLAMMAETGPEWAALIAEWDSLAAEYGEGKFKRVSDRIAALTRPAPKQVQV